MSFSSLLVANRGEVARRIFRTARDMGLRCVAVFTESDAGAPFVREADEAVRLATGYLDLDAVVEAAVRSRAGAVHPGYGFLAENAAFARAVVDAGLVWVGPSPEVIGAMGDKITAKQAAAEAGVPVLPSTEDPAAADDVGYPLLVKAAAGGGGKGMRVVTSPGGLDEAVAAARREARSAFGDDRIFLERFVERSRHVEIQILGDHHGRLIHLGERECSIQRRHQKILEESPSPAVDPALRERMGAAALSLGRAMDYRSAGTVEFLVDDATREFFFLEVNTRLQVEHPVTEEVTGVDLVREQLRIAAGAPLGIEQDDLVFSGHAVEARLYAEDPAAGFLPATGTLAAFEPADEPAVRWDAGVEAGSVIGVDFDPMIAKVIAHGPTRAEAAGRLARALERLHLGGVTTNREFLAATLRSREFLAGDTTTDFIERVQPRVPVEVSHGERRAAAITAALWLQGANRRAAPVWREIPSGWRNARLPRQRVVLASGDERFEIDYESRRDGTFAVGESTAAVVHRWTPELVDVEIDGRRRTSRVTRAGDDVFVQAPSGTVAFRLVPRFTVPDAEAPAGALTAPMPGVVLEVRVGGGDEVAAGQVLVIIEAMKMEHHVSSPSDGVVSEVRVEPGDQVDNGALLLVIDTGDEADDASEAEPAAASEGS